VAANILLFSYGTLQKRDVQIAIFGRELKGRADALSGYTRRIVPVRNKAAAAAQGESAFAKCGGDVEAGG